MAALVHSCTGRKYSEAQEALITLLARSYVLPEFVGISQKCMHSLSAVTGFPSAIAYFCAARSVAACSSLSRFFFFNYNTLRNTTTELKVFFLTVGKLRIAIKRDFVYKTPETPP